VINDHFYIEDKLKHTCLTISNKSIDGVMKCEKHIVSDFKLDNDMFNEESKRRDDEIGWKTDDKELNRMDREMDMFKQSFKESMKLILSNENVNILR